MRDGRDAFETGLADELRGSLRAEAAAAWGHVERGRVLDLAARRRSDRVARRRRWLVLLAAAMVVVPVTALAMVGASRIDRDAVVLPPRPTVSSGAFASATPLDTPEPRGTFTKSGDLVVPRQGHMAILLRDGRVMVIGGRTEKGGLPPTEIFDPRTGHSALATPTTSAFDHGLIDLNESGFSATSLADGRVLVAGGMLDGPVRDAILFDPVSGTSTVTGPMTVARAGHAAVRLPEGRVLIMGGRDAERSLATAELFDPTTASFSPTGSMATERETELDLAITATVLPSGRVLIRGGGTSDELYDPSSGRFGRNPSVGSQESGSVLLLDDARIRQYDLASGWLEDITPADPPELVRAFGERCAKLAWDCQTGHVYTLLADGTVLRTGGKIAAVEPPGAERNYRWADQTIGEIVDPSSKAVTPTGPFAQPRTGHTATLLPDGRVLIIGGRDPDQEPMVLVKSAELYTPD